MSEWKTSEFDGAIALASELLTSGEVVIEATIAEQPSAHVVGACAMAARSLRVVGAMSKLVPSYWDVNDALLRVSLESAILSLLLVMGGEDEVQRQSQEQLHRTDLYARENQIEFDSDRDMQKPRPFEQLVREVARLRAMKSPEFDPNRFIKQIYDELYRGTSTTAIHGLGPAGRHFQGDSLVLNPLPQSVGETSASSLTAAIAVPALALTELGNAVGIDFQQLRDLEEMWKRLLSEGDVLPKS